MTEAISHISAQAITEHVKRVKPRKIQQRAFFNAEKGCIELRRGYGVYRVKVGGNVVRRQGSHTLAFAAYEKSLEWFLKGRETLVEIRELLEISDYNIHTKLGCLLDLMLVVQEKGKGISAAHKHVARVYAQLDQTFLDLQMVDENDERLQGLIEFYFSCVSELYEHSPSGTIYTGKIKSEGSTEGADINRALQELDSIFQSITTPSIKNKAVKGEQETLVFESLSSMSLDRIKKATPVLFDGLAITQLQKENPDNVFVLCFLILQIFRFLTPFEIAKWLRRHTVRHGTSRLNQLIIATLKLENTEEQNHKVNQALKLIDEFKKFMYPYERDRLNALSENFALVSHSIEYQIQKLCEIRDRFVRKQRG